MEIEPEMLQKLEKEIGKEKICSCLIAHRGETIFHYYKNKKMESKLFKINSITKSVLSVLIGIAIDRGDLEGVHTPIGHYLPHVGADKQELTIEHLLTMTSGFEWPEWGAWGGRPFPMINSADWVKYVLEQPMVEKVGERMIYNSGCSQLLGAILQKATGEKVAAYAEKVLFKPLEIEEYSWQEDAKQITIGGFGLCLQAADLLKLGMLMIQNGRWENRQIVSEHWATRSTTAMYHTYDHVGSYGYHWWVMADETKRAHDRNLFFAMGYGGQYIFVSPVDQLVVVFTSDLYKNTFLPLRLFRKHFVEGA